MWREPGSRSICEDEIKVTRFRRILEPTEDHGESAARGSNPSDATRNARLLQVYDENGRLRTLDVADIVEVK